MLEVLRRIVQEVGASQHLGQALSILVKRVKQAMAADVCSIYLRDEGTEDYVLAATDGLNPDSVGQVRLGKSQGLISVVVETAEPLNLDDAPEHSRYRFVSETGEEYFHGFLGVPIIHQRKVRGVLVVRHRARRRFDEEEVAFLVTAAAQLAGAIAHAEASGGYAIEGPNADYVGAVIDGVPGAPGVALGTGLVVYRPADLDAVPDRKIKDVDAEVAIFNAAVAAVQADVRQLGERIGTHLTAEDRALFDAYSLMLGSESLLDGTLERIRAGNWASGALRDTINEHARVFEEMDDAYMCERAEDVRDLGRRVLMRLQSGVRRPIPYPEKTILVGEDISAIQLAEVPRERLVGVVSLKGSRSSHVAILARAMGVPAVVGAADLAVGRIDGCDMVVDGYRGRVYVQPSPVVRSEYTRLAREEAELLAGLAELRHLPAETPDGVRIPLYANSGLISDVGPALTSGAEGIGLYRTEFPFMIRDRFPGEEEQARAYRQVLESFAPRPVVLRTLDIGGDKALPYFPITEDNPFLGWRGIRITLDHPELFLTQIRAMLRASAGLDNLHLMLPMVSHVAEVDEARALIVRACQELREHGEEIVDPKIGVMIEVPSAVYQCEPLARRVDFLSIGSNDLTQYLLAVDRNNARVASLYDSLHPAVLRAISDAVAGAHRQGRPIGVCGEMAGDPLSALLLLGMGVDSLSMSVSSLPRVKRIIRHFTHRRAEELLRAALQKEDPVAVRRELLAELEQASLGGLVGVSA